MVRARPAVGTENVSNAGFSDDLVRLPAPLEQQLDAVLHLGPESRTALAPSAAPCKRPGFLEERLRRIALTGIPKFEAENIQKLCSPVSQ